MGAVWGSGYLSDKIKIGLHKRTIVLKCRGMRKKVSYGQNA
jgi:hypothetical protein